MYNYRQRQGGSALYVTLVMLVVLTVLGTTTMHGTVVDQRVAGNTRHMVDSFQRADAGVSATLSLIGTADDPFDGTSKSDPFAGFDAATHPLRKVTDSRNMVSVSTDVTATDSECARSERASSSNKIVCEYYEVTSAHAETGTGVSAAVVQGVRREIIGSH